MDAGDRIVFILIGLVIGYFIVQFLRFFMVI
jgi:hypothetical protein